MADHSKPVLGTPYDQWTSQIGGRIDDALKQGRSDTVTLTNPPTGMIRWNVAGNKWVHNTGTPAAPSWAELSSVYDINVTSATKWTTGRTVALTGDVTGTSAAFDGSGNLSFATVLATVNSNVGSFGSATQAATFAVDGKGRLTAAGAVTITPAWGSVTGKPTTVAGYGISDMGSQSVNYATSAGSAASASNASALLGYTDYARYSQTVTWAAMQTFSGGATWGNGTRHSHTTSGFSWSTPTWYRVLSWDTNNQGRALRCFIFNPSNHETIEVRMARGAGGSNTAEIINHSYYSYISEITNVRVVDGGINGVSYLDVKFGGSASNVQFTVDVESFNSRTAGGTYTYEGFSGQGTGSLGGETDCDVSNSAGWYHYAIVSGSGIVWKRNRNGDQWMLASLYLGGNTANRVPCINSADTLSGVTINYPTLSNSWANFDSANYTPVRYMRDLVNNTVRVEGVAKDGTVGGSILFNLPAGYRPVKAQGCAANGENAGLTAVAVGTLAVYADGNVVLNVPSGYNGRVFFNLEFSLR